MADAEKDPVKDTFLQAATTLEIEHKKIEAEIKEINNKLELAKPFAPHALPGQKPPHAAPPKPTDAQKALTSQLQETKALDRAFTSAETYAKTIARDGKDTDDDKVEGFYSQIKSALKHAENTSHKDIILDIRRDTHAVLPHPDDEKDRELKVDIAITEKVRNVNKKPGNTEKETASPEQKSGPLATGQQTGSALSALDEASKKIQSEIDHHPRFYNPAANDPGHELNLKTTASLKKAINAAHTMVEQKKVDPEKVAEFYNDIKQAQDSLEKIRFNDHETGTFPAIRNNMRTLLDTVKKDFNAVDSLKDKTSSLSPPSPTQLTARNQAVEALGLFDVINNPKDAGDVLVQKFTQRPDIKENFTIAQEIAKKIIEQKGENIPAADMKKFHTAMKAMIKTANDVNDKLRNKGDSPDLNGAQLLPKYLNKIEEALRAVPDLSDKTSSVTEPSKKQMYAVQEADPTQLLSSPLANLGPKRGTGTPSISA